MIVSYMGTKRHLAHHVRQLALDCSPGPLLDGFSGMCAIGRSLASERQIWSNDLQAFAHLVSTAQFCSGREKVNVSSLIRSVQPLFEQNMALCRTAFSAEIEAEIGALAERRVETLSQDFTASQTRAQAVSSTHTCLPSYSLLAARYGGTYFGHAQSAEGDSIRYGLDTLQRSKIIDDDTYRWGVIALCSALSKVSTTTGHFAQPLRPKVSNVSKHISQRVRSVWNEWIEILPFLRASGTRKWRMENRSFRGDTIDLIKDFEGTRSRPSLVYADPPYTKDQYSRYYHVLETIVLYDFPGCEGAGLYRYNRATSAFSQSSRIEEALDQLFEATRRISASLILSYPATGLLPNSTTVIPQMIRQHFGKFPDVLDVDYQHSTMGASKGSDKQSVRELLYRVAA